MELRYRREAVVGLLLVAGAALFLWMALWLRGRSLTRSEQLTVVFADVVGLKVGDPVRTSGVAIGHVTAIRLESPGQVQVRFTLGSAPPPREDASAEIRAADLFGARYIEYFPGRSQQPIGGTLRGTRVRDIVEMATALGGQGGTLLDTAAAAARELRATLAEARRLVLALGRSGTSASSSLAGTMEELRRVLQRLDLLVARDGQEVGETLRSLQGAAGNLDRLVTELSRTNSRIDSLLVKVSGGQGLAGTLVNDTTLVSELRATNTALRLLLEDIRADPGRYFRLRL